MNELANREGNVGIRLIYGMAVRDGVWEIDHRQFIGLVQNGLLECYYRIQDPATHAKVYIWVANDSPVRAFAGSANYTRTGFGLIPGPSNAQDEAMSEVDPAVARNFFQQTLAGSMEIQHDDIQEHINIRLGTPVQPPPDDDDHRTVPLLENRGRGPGVAGLNWVLNRRGGPGGRNPAGGYIQIGAPLGRSDFFPARPEEFNLVTDDGEQIRVVRAQKSNRPANLPPGGGDAIETNPNHVLGLYFRHRLGLPDDARIEPHHLVDYGRLNVTFIKLDEGQFLMDFSPRGPGYEP